MVAHRQVRHKQQCEGSENQQRVGENTRPPWLKPTRQHSSQWLSTAWSLLTSRPTRSGHNPERHRKAHVGKKMILLAPESWNGYANVRNRLPRRENEGGSRDITQSRKGRTKPQTTQIHRAKTATAQREADTSRPQSAVDAPADSVRHGRAASDNWIRHLPTPHPITAVDAFFSRKKRAENKS